jgi:hypothetical protein
MFFYSVPSIQIPTASEHLFGGFLFRHFDPVAIASIFCSHVLHVFNNTITSSFFHSMWKMHAMAIIQPAPKVGTPSGPSDSRPIRIVSVLP